MSLSPAQQEAPSAPEMSNKTPKAKRATRSKAEAKELLAQEASEDSLDAASENEANAAAPPVPPVFVQRDLKGPDGSIRSGWEMWIGDHCFGRADSKELLLASFERLQSPPSSFHWREVRNRMPMRGRPKAVQAQEPEELEEQEELQESQEAVKPATLATSEQDNSWSWDKAAEPLIADEGPEGFQEPTWETPAQ